MDFTPSPAAAFSDEFELHLNAACQEINNRQTPRTYLGGSRLGVECERQLGFEYHHAPKDAGREFSGKIIRVFDRGHDTEIRMVEYLRAAGFTLLTERPNGKQFGFYVAKHPETGEARIAGHCDGIITGAPDWFPACGSARRSTTSRGTTPRRRASATPSPSITSRCRSIRPICKSPRPRRSSQP